MSGQKTSPLVEKKEIIDVQKETDSIKKGKLDEVIDHIEKNRYEVSSFRLTQCIDGRTSKAESQKGVSMPGGTPGQVAVIMAVVSKLIIDFDLENKKEEIFSENFDAFEEYMGEKKWTNHTGEHSKQIKMCGHNLESDCGHLIFISDLFEKYGLCENALKYVLEAFKKVEEGGVRANPILPGVHEEKGVLVINGEEKYGVYQNDFDNQYFVYSNCAINFRHTQIAELLIKKLIKFGIEVEIENMVSLLNNTMKKHLMLSARVLAKTKPIYEVKFEENGNYKVVLIGEV